MARRKILYFSSVSWSWAKQRPHFLCEKMAESNCDVTYLALNAEKTTDAFFCDNHLHVREVQLVRGYMRSALVRDIDRFLLGKILEKCGDFDTVILANPIQITLLPQALLCKTLVYDCMDLLLAFYPKSQKELIAKTEQKLCDKADAILVSSEPLCTYLCEKYAMKREKSTVILNAYAPEACEASALKPQTLATPNLVYVGTIDAWFDDAVLVAFMKKHPEFTLYLIGPIQAEMQQKLHSEIPSCVITGAKPHAQALAYVQSADVVLLPFRINALVEMVDPIKLYEYIAMGKSIVSSYWDALAHFSKYDAIAFYQNEAEFETQILRQCKKSYPPPADFAAENAWQSRADKALQWIETHQKALNER